MAMSTNEVKDIEKIENNDQQEKEPVNNTPEPQEPSGDENNVQNPPANVPEGEKKGFHPIQGLKNFGAKFSEEHPKITNGLKTAGKVAAGVAIGAAGTVVVLAKVASDKAASEENSDEGYDSDDDDYIDSTATEVDDEQ